VFWFLAILKFELRASGLPGRCSDIWATLPALWPLVYKKTFVCWFIFFSVYRMVVSFFELVLMCYASENVSIFKLNWNKAVHNILNFLKSQQHLSFQPTRAILFICVFALFFLISVIRGVNFVSLLKDTHLHIFTFWAHS
jgi:hypothetical protein